MTICEDIWLPDGPGNRAARGGATVVLNISASPYHVGKGDTREEMLRTRARDDRASVVFCNLVGGQDELVFDGRSVVLGPDGEVLARAPVVRRRRCWSPTSTRAAPSRRGCATRARAAAASAGPLQPDVTLDAGPEHERAAAAPAGRAAAGLAPTRRSGARSSSACATTWRRTASSAC